MNKYRVTLVCHLDVTVEVEADSEDAAFDEAAEHENADVNLCHFCANKFNDYTIEWDSDASDVEEV